VNRSESKQKGNTSDRMPNRSATAAAVDGTHTAAARLAM
jgi:hypothetical protein